MHLPDINPMCLCGGEFEDAQYYFMFYAYFDDLGLLLREKLNLFVTLN